MEIKVIYKVGHKEFSSLPEAEKALFKILLKEEWSNAGIPSYSFESFLEGFQCSKKLRDLLELGIDSIREEEVSQELKSQSEEQVTIHSGIPLVSKPAEYDLPAPETPPHREDDEDPSVEF